MYPIEIILYICENFKSQIMKNLSKVIILSSAIALSSCSASSDAIEEDLVQNPSIPINVPTGCGSTATVSDIDGNVYPIVEIGDRCWMQQNLRTTTYNDGMPIEAYEVHSDVNVAYGNLYRRDMTDNNFAKLCPSGWRIANQSDWESLIATASSFENGLNNALKSSEFWYNNYYDPNPNITNATGFSATPNGFKNAQSVIFGRSPSDFQYAYFLRMGVINGAYAISSHSPYVSNQVINPEWMVACRCVRED